MAATVKVITFALPEEIVAQAESLLSNNGRLISVAPFARKQAGLVLTRLAGTKEKLLKKSARVMGERGDWIPWQP